MPESLLSPLFSVYTCAAVGSDSVGTNQSYEPAIAALIPAVEFLPTTYSSRYDLPNCGKIIDEYQLELATVECQALSVVQIFKTKPHYAY